MYQRQDLVKHSVRQFRKFSESEVSIEEFTKRVTACESCVRRSGILCMVNRKPCASYAKPVENDCPVWSGGVPPVISRPTAPVDPSMRSQFPPVKKMVCISCLFNPLGLHELNENAKQFREHAGDVLFIELSYEGTYLFDDSIHVEGDESSRYIWQKERLLNLAIDSLPADVDAVAIIDADLIFENRHWRQETESRLQTSDIVQMFESVKYYGPDSTLQETKTGYAKSTSENPGVPGGAIAFRRTLIPDGLHEECILGGGDSVMIQGWNKRGLAITNTSGCVRHLFHGDQENKQHQERNESLGRLGFDFNQHIDSNPGGPLKWKLGSEKLKDAATRFFQARSVSRDVVTARQPQVVVKVNSPVEPQSNRETYTCDVILPYSRPNYRYLEDSIKSVLNQNFVKTVIHLINDGLDKDPIGKKYSKLENVRWYQNTDRPAGPYVTYNRLFDHLEHDIIANQDSDDLSLPMRFYKSIQLIEQGYDIVGGSMEQFVTYDDPSERMRRALTAKPYHYSGKVYAASPSGTIVNSTMVMKKSVYKACNGMAPWIAGADSEFYERAIQAGYKAAAMQDIVALRRLHDPSLSNDQVTSGHGSNLREEIKRMTAESIARQKQGPDHSIGGLSRHRNDKQLEVLEGRIKVQSADQRPFETSHAQRT